MLYYRSEYPNMHTKGLLATRLEDIPQSLIHKWHSVISWNSARVWTRSVGWYGISGLWDCFLECGPLANKWLGLLFVGLARRVLSFMDIKLKVLVEVHRVYVESIKSNNYTYHVVGNAIYLIQYMCLTKKKKN